MYLFCLLLVSFLLNFLSPQGAAPQQQMRDILGQTEHLQSAPLIRNLDGMAVAPKANLAQVIDQDFEPTENKQNHSRAVTFSVASSSMSLVQTAFKSVSTLMKPDSQIAVGPNHVLIVTNGGAVVYSKSGAQISSHSSFFGCSGSCFDPRALYDERDGRFIVTFANRNNPSGIQLAVSQTSDPTGNWYEYFVPVGDSSNWPDFPSLGLSSTAVYIAFDRIFTGGADYEIKVVGLPELLQGATSLNITTFANLRNPSGNPAGGIMAALTYGDSDYEYLVSNGESNSSIVISIHLWKINTVGQPVLSVVDIPVATMQPPLHAVQPGTNSTINTGGTGMLNAAWRNGSLWCSHNALGETGGNSEIRWYQIDTGSATVVQSGAITGAGDAYYGGVAVGPDGEVNVTYTTSSSTQFASAAWSHRGVGDPAGSMPLWGIYGSGNSPYEGSAWGDYSGISIDPTDNTTWGLAESADSSDPAVTFRTWAVQLRTTGPLPDNRSFVSQQYLDFLDRQSDSGGLDAWASQLNKGVSRPQLILDFINSQEFAQKGMFVAQAYLGILARDADYSGFRNWLTWLENGGGELALIDAFLNSGEFQSNFGGNLDNGHFVTRIYENILLRQPDSGGYNFWVEQLNSRSLTKDQVALYVLQSTEFQNLTSSQNRVRISLLYFDMLRRQPDPDGFNGWVSAFNSGAPLIDVISGFLNSGEYSSRFQ